MEAKAHKQFHILNYTILLRRSFAENHPRAKRSIDCNEQAFAAEKKARKDDFRSAPTQNDFAADKETRVDVSSMQRVARRGNNYQLSSKSVESVEKQQTADALPKKAHVVTARASHHGGRRTFDAVQSTSASTAPSESIATKRGVTARQHEFVQRRGSVEDNRGDSQKPDNTRLKRHRFFLCWVIFVGIALLWAYRSTQSTAREIAILKAEIDGLKGTATTFAAVKRDLLSMVSTTHCTKQCQRTESVC